MSGCRRKGPRLRVVDHRVGRAAIQIRPAGRRPDLEVQSLTEPRVQREIDAVPPVGARRSPKSVFERDVILRAPGGGRRRHHLQRDRVSAAAGQPRIRWGQNGELLVVAWSPKRVVGHLLAVEPPAVVADLHRYAWHQLLLKVDPPLPVVLTDAPAGERGRIHGRRRIGLPEVQRVAGQRGALAVLSEVHDVAVDHLVVVRVPPVAGGAPDDASGWAVAGVLAVVGRGIEVVTEVELHRGLAVAEHVVGHAHARRDVVERVDPRRSLEGIRLRH